MNNSEERSVTPLHEAIGTVAAFWAFANLGYYFLLPWLGFSIDYNLAPVPISIYFFLWSVVSIFYFWESFSDWLVVDTAIWLYVATSIGFGLLVSALIYALSFFPALRGPVAAPYTDLLFITPWYFLPKAFEVLMQQLLISSLVLELYRRFHSYNAMLVGYALCFVGTHIVLFALTEAPALHSLSIIAWASATTFIFPYLLLKVRGGFVYSYAIHLTSYIFLAMILHTFPPPGYFGI